MAAKNFDRQRTDRNLAFTSADRIDDFQVRQYRSHLQYCLQHSPYYKTVLGDLKMDPERFELKDSAALPLTSKSHIEEFNDEFCAVPPEDIVDIVLSSGTTGKPTRIMYTESDLQRLAYNEELSLLGCGITPSDKALLTCTMDRCFIAGLAYFSGLRQLGAAVIRNGQNTLESHAAIIKQLQPSVIVGVPSFLKKLGQFCCDDWQDSSARSVKKIICIGEPLRDKTLKLTDTGEILVKLWQAELYSTYASSEIITSFCECSAGQGGHLLPDLGFVEIVDDDGHPLPAGKTGEVVLTPFGITGMPLIRFKTGDISFLMTDPCKCGRVSPRLAPILGRKAQMLKIKGTTLYPQAIFSALESINGIDEYYVLADAENSLSDQVTIHVAVNDQSITPDVIQGKLQARLRVKPRIIIEPALSVKEAVFNPNSRKPIRFFDNRKQLLK